MSSSGKSTAGKSTLSWQKLESIHQTKTGKGVRDEDLVVQRAKVFGGWLVRCRGVYEMQRKYKGIDGQLDYEASAGMGVGITFVPDPDHEWDPADYIEDAED